MFGISGMELFIIVAFALFIFGPDKIPEIARTVGRFMREFKKTQEMMEAQIRAEMYKADWEKTAPPPEQTAEDDEEGDEEEEEGPEEEPAKPVPAVVGTAALEEDHWDEEEDEEG